MTHTIARRGAFVAPVVRVPNPTLLLNEDGLGIVGNSVTTWLADTDQLFTATPTAEPSRLSPRLNNKGGALFQIAGNRLVCPSLYDGSSSEYSFEVVMWPENAAGSPGVELLGYAQNNTVDTTKYVAFPHQASGFSMERVGLYANSAWRTINSLPSHKPQVLMFTYDHGLLMISRNGTLLGAHVGSHTSDVEFGNFQLGASDSALPVTLGFRGTIYEVRAWCNRVLTPAQIERSADQRLTAFAIDPDAYYPANDATTITGHWDSRGRRGTVPGGAFNGSELNLWLDNSTFARHMAQGTAGQYPSAGDNINGRYSIRTGVNKRLAMGTNWAGFCGTGAQKTYDIKIPIRPRSITSTQATAAHLRDCVIMDISGFLGIVLYLDSGVPTAALYHYSGGTKLLPFPITLGEETLLHAWYDGSTIFFRVGDGAVQSMGSVGNPGDISIPVVLGHGFTTAGYADADIPEVLIRSSYNAITANADRAYFSRVYNFDV